MARLYEFQGKELLKKFKIFVPTGKVVSSAKEAMNFASEIGKSVVLKAQVWTTKRASVGGIQFANSPNEAFEKARELFEDSGEYHSIDEIEKYLSRIHLQEEFD